MSKWIQIMSHILLQFLLSKASQYQITLIKTFQIAQKLCSISFQNFELMIIVMNKFLCKLL